MITAETVNSPDLVFQQYCKEVFGVNRGIYNTIDEWFFQAGAVSVLERRQIIVNFSFRTCLNRIRGKRQLC
ncbi:hypothetical protein [Metabacillus sp. FJAT-52054]|uniref:Uncharacterized protein n=1 Tax=Metabacillus sediminis TaxID=3117746 RepID=A0ABZ2NKR9_9BACI